jgi:glycosyltransferase involved in cell wall biosynthesis
MYYIKRIDEIKPENCRKHAEHFSYERMAEEYLKLYKEVIEGRTW